jgi:WhiB family transcriptional regulator, redox-sensing transcriptional regulator
MTAPTRRASTNAAPLDTWMQYGRCRETDPDLFFPEGRGGAVTNALKQAKKVCGTCPVRALCLDWAVTTGQTAGVWGGLDEDERLPLRREHVEQRATGYARCIDAQDLIERRVAEGKSHRQIGDELGVCHSAVGRAWRFFQTERTAVTEEVAAV